MDNVKKDDSKPKAQKFEVLAKELRLGSKKDGTAKKTYKRGEFVELSDAKTIAYLKSKHKIK